MAVLRKNEVAGVKVFKFIVVLLLTLLTVQTGYYALLYKVSTSTGAFLICIGITLFVISDGGLNSKNGK